MSGPSPLNKTERHGKGCTGHVNLLLCTNALFLQHAAVCVTSVLTNNPDLFFDIVIVSQQNERLDEEKFRGSIAKFSNHTLEFRKFVIPDELVLPLNPLAHYTLDTYSRLWIGEFFPSDVTRVLYLDADIVAVGSLASLWTVDLSGALMGAVDIPGSNRGVERLDMPPDAGYFNAGVLVIDLARVARHSGGAVGARLYSGKSATRAVRSGCIERLFLQPYKTAGLYMERDTSVFP